MSEQNKSNPQQEQQADGGPSGMTRRPAGSGEGLDSVITRLREQEDQRGQNDPTGLSGGGN